MWKNWEIIKKCERISENEMNFLKKLWKWEKYGKIEKCESKWENRETFWILREISRETMKTFQQKKKSVGFECKMVGFEREQKGKYWEKIERI